MHQRLWIRSFKLWIKTSQKLRCLQVFWTISLLAPYIQLEITKQRQHCNISKARMHYLWRSLCSKQKSSNLIVYDWLSIEIPSARNLINAKRRGSEQVILITSSGNHANYDPWSILSYNTHLLTISCRVIDYFWWPPLASAIASKLLILQDWLSLLALSS